MPQKEEVENWYILDHEEHSSTMANFIGGYSRHNERDDILIWDVKPENTYTYKQGDEVPDWTNYVIEILVNEEKRREKFAETEQGAWTKAKRVAERCNNNLE